MRSLEDQFLALKMMLAPASAADYAETVGFPPLPGPSPASR